MHIVRTSILFTLLVACGGQVGNVVRPKDLTSTDALGTSTPVTACLGEPKLATPFVVDLESRARVALEAGMKGKNGLVVVAYDCTSLRVLPACKIEGTYDYTATSKKESVVQIKNQDELGVNLPLSAGRLGVELKSGRTIDLALVLVGLRSTSVGKASRESLKGDDCEGATHFIQNASVGAFSMATGSVGRAAAVAELFKVGASASSETGKDAKNYDGSLEACKSQDPDAASPPGECRSPLSLQLLPIGAAAKTQAPEAKRDGAEAPPPPQNPCRDGYAYANGICTRTPAEAAHLCAPRDYDDCKVQCEKGSAESCYAYGSWIGKDVDLRSEFYKKACDGGFADGCGSRAIFEWVAAKGQPVSSPRKQAAVTLAKQGCDKGGPYSCLITGLLLFGYGDDSTGDREGGVRALNRACQLGNPRGCVELARRFWSGDDGFAKDPKKAIEHQERACRGDAFECVELASLLADKKAGSSRDAERAVRLVDGVCKEEYAIGCDDAVTVALLAGKDSLAVTWATDGCTTFESSCALVGMVLADGHGGKKNVAAAKQIFASGCKRGDAMSCTKLGDLPAGPAAKPKANPKKKK